MKQIKMQKKIYRAAGWIEIMVSAVVLIAIMLVAIGLIQNLYCYIADTGADPAELSGFLGSAFQIVIGVEFIKMLCKHTPATVVEVLMFAIARQMVVEHSTPLENLICIAGITVLFAIRRFLFTEADKHDHYQENITVTDDTEELEAAETANTAEAEEAPAEESQE